MQEKGHQHAAASVVEEPGNHAARRAPKTDLPGCDEHPSDSGWLLIFGVRLINPLDGPLGEEPGWRGFALPGLPATRSPLVSTAILAVLITVWHLPLFFLEGGSLTLSTIVGGVVGPFAFKVRCWHPRAGWHTVCWVQLPCGSI